MKKIFILLILTLSFVKADAILLSGVNCNPPVNIVEPVISGVLSSGNLLTQAQGTWSGSLPMTFTYQWYTCFDPECSIPAIIVGAINNTYLLTPAEIGSYIEGVVTARNGTCGLTLAPYGRGPIT